MVPEAVEPARAHIEQTADIRGFRRVEKDSRFRRVRIASRTVAIEHRQRDQRIEEVARRARVKIEALLQFFACGRPLCQLSEEADFNRRKQSTRGEKPHTQLQDCGGSQLRLGQWRYLT